MPLLHLNPSKTFFAQADLMRYDAGLIGIMTLARQGSDFRASCGWEIHFAGSSVVLCSAATTNALIRADVYRVSSIL